MTPRTATTTSWLRASRNDDSASTPTSSCGGPLWGLRCAAVVLPVGAARGRCARARPRTGSCALPSGASDPADQLQHVAGQAAGGRPRPRTPRPRGRPRSPRSSAPARARRPTARRRRARTPAASRCAGSTRGSAAGRRARSRAARRRPGTAGRGRARPSSRRGRPASRRRTAPPGRPRRGARRPHGRGGARLLALLVVLEQRQVELGLAAEVVVEAADAGARTAPRPRRWRPPRSRTR